MTSAGCKWRERGEHPRRVTLYDTTAITHPPRITGWHDRLHRRTQGTGWWSGEALAPERLVDGAGETGPPIW
jgi:hypothetical protein